MNGDQEIEAPARPARWPSSRARWAAAACSAAWGTRRAAVLDDGGGTGTGVAPVQPNGTGTAPNTPDADDFKAYADCLDKARPEDTDALQRCSELLYR